MLCIRLSVNAVVHCMLAKRADTFTHKFQSRGVSALTGNDLSHSTMFIYLLTLPSYVHNEGLGNHNSYCQLLWPQLYRNKLHSTVITHNEQCHNGHAKVIIKSLETTCYWQARQTTGGIAFDTHTFPCAGTLNVVSFL